MKTDPLNIAIIGSTGSLGRTILDVIDSLKEEINIVALGTGSNVERLKEQVSKYRPNMVSIAHGEWDSSDSDVQLVSASELVTADEVAMVFIAHVGKSILRATWDAVKAGKKIALGNIDLLFVMGSLLKKTAEETGATIFPLDDEPAGVLQTLWGEDRETIDQVTITSTWGTINARRLRSHGLSALVRPSRKVGQRRSIDSSTLITKATQLSAIHHLYDVPVENIRVVYHPESVVRALTEFQDGSVKAVLSNPDMRVPVQLALAYPDRWSNPQVTRVNLLELGKVSFESLEEELFASYKLALEAIKLGETYPAVVAAANDAAVDLFLSQQIGFTEIAGIIEMTLGNHRSSAVENIDDVFVADEWARTFVGSQVQY